MNAPTTVSELFPSKYLKAEDLKGNTVSVVVRAVTMEEVHDTINHQDAIKAVVWFEHARRGLILNKTQALALATATGTEVFSEWVGTPVSLRPGRSPNGKPTIVVNATAKEI